jgi:adenosine deaminase
MGFKSAFMPYAQKRAMLADAISELKRLGKGSLDSKKESL